MHCGHLLMTVFVYRLDEAVQMFIDDCFCL